MTSTLDARHEARIALVVEPERVGDVDVGTYTMDSSTNPMPASPCAAGERADTRPCTRAYAAARRAGSRARLTSARSGRAPRAGGDRCSPILVGVAERRQGDQLDVAGEPEHLARRVRVEGGDPAGAQAERRRREDEVVHGDGGVDLVVGLVVHAPPRLAGHGDEGDDQRRLGEPPAAVDARQLLFPARGVHDEHAERLPVRGGRRPPRRLQHLRSFSSSTASGLYPRTL